MGFFVCLLFCGWFCDSLGFVFFFSINHSLKYTVLRKSKVLPRGSFGQKRYYSTLKQFQHFQRLVLFQYFWKLRNWKYRFTICGQRRVELLSEKLGIHPGCGRPVLSRLCHQDDLSVYHSSPGRDPSRQEIGYTGIDLCQLLTLSLFFTV